MDNPDCPFSDEQVAWLDARYRLNVPTIEAMVQEQTAEAARQAVDDEADDA